MYVCCLNIKGQRLDILLIICCTAAPYDRIRIEIQTVTKNCFHCVAAARMSKVSVWLLIIC